MEIERTYLIKKEELQSDFGLNLDDYFSNGADSSPFLVNVYDSLSTFVIVNNSNLRDDPTGGNNALQTILKANPWMEFPWKKAQSKLASNMISFGPGADMFDRSLIDIIQGDLNMVLANGWQKGR